MSHEKNELKKYIKLHIISELDLNVVSFILSWQCDEDLILQTPLMAKWNFLQSAMLMIPSKKINWYLHQFIVCDPKIFSEKGLFFQWTKHSCNIATIVKNSSITIFFFYIASFCSNNEIYKHRDNKYYLL